MANESGFEYFLIREGLVLARVRTGGNDAETVHTVEFFDVRTGVQLRGIHPPFSTDELSRGHSVPTEQAAVIIASGMPLLGDWSVDLSKVVNILEVKQRRLDSVVADSVLDRVQLIRDMLQDLLNVAATARPEERFWLSRQVLPLLNKFSGRELAELEEILEWMKKRPRT